MLRVAKGILGSEDLAWDAVQETLLRVHVRGLNTESPRSVLVGLAVPGDSPLRAPNGDITAFKAPLMQMIVPLIDGQPWDSV